MFYDKLKELCDEKGVKPSRVAVECGFSKGTVSHWKNDGTVPQREILLKIAEFFDVPVDHLLGNIESRYIEKECDICGMRYNANDEHSVLDHYNLHSKFITARKYFGEHWVLNYKEEEKRKEQCWAIIKNANDYNDSFLFTAAVDLYGAWFSHSLHCNDYNLNHPKINDFIAMMLYQPHQKKIVLDKLPKQVQEMLLSTYGEKPGIEDGKSIYDIPEEQKAKIIQFKPISTRDLKIALWEGDSDIVDDEMIEDVKDFAKLLAEKKKRKLERKE